MRTIVHLSDLHFGNVFNYLLEPLREIVDQLSPDLLVISGDFVEHATTTEFEDAEAYLKKLPQPQLLVPGNHDLPFYDPLKRFRQGLGKYLKYITADLEPLYSDEEMVVAGVNTPRVFPMKSGRINAARIETVREQLCGEASKHIYPSRIKVLVTHHPLDLPDRFTRRQLVRHAESAVEKLSRCVDLMLAGHIHLSSTGGTAARYTKTGHSVVFAQAGTAISKRNKGEPNSFNVIRLEPDRIEIQHYRWSDGAQQFQPSPGESFEHTERGWRKRVAPRESEQVQL